jgi:uncharacterized protein YkwD
MLSSCLKLHSSDTLVRGEVNALYQLVTAAGLAESVRLGSALHALQRRLLLLRLRERIEMMMAQNSQAGSDQCINGRRHLLGRNLSRLALVALLSAFIALTAWAGLSTPQKAEALDSEEQTFLTQINNYRAQNGLGPLTLNDKLDDVARWMANDMATHNYFSHADSLGRDPFQRTADLGYNTWRGENLVAGVEGAAQAFQMWHDSPHHNENMLGSHYTVIGIARAYSASSSFGWYWATEFAGEDIAAPPPPAPAAAPGPVATPAPGPAPVPEQRTHPVTPPQVPAHMPQPTPAPMPTPARTPAHSGLVFEGVPPMDFGNKTGGSFLSALLNLEPAVDRLMDRVDVRVVH